MKTLNNVAVASTTLGSQVADNGTFTVTYPAGTNQQDFTSGLAGSDSYVVLNDNDKWVIGDPGFALTFNANDITVTNQTGAALPAGTDVSINLDMAEDDGQELIPFRIDLASVAAADVVTDFQPGFDGVIADLFFVTDKPATTAAKAATLSAKISGTAVTGGAVALTSANATPQGKIVEGSAVTDNNAFKRDDKISIVGSAVTAFAEGSGTLFLRCRKS